MAENCKVVIFCGGKGTRIREVTDLIPKPLIPIGNRPILWHIMKGYHSQGFNDFVLCLGYKGNAIRDFFLNYRNHATDLTLNTKTGDIKLRDNDIEDWNVTLVDTGEDNYTGRRLDLVRKHLENEQRFMVTYGDGVSDVNMRNLLDFHNHQGTIGTITAVNPRSKYGKVTCGNSGLVGSFVEKPALKDDLINGGYMVLNKEFLDLPMIKENVPLEKILEDLTEKRKLSLYTHRGCWYSMDSPADYELLQDIWKSGRADWKTW